MQLQIKMWEVLRLEKHDPWKEESEAGSRSSVTDALKTATGRIPVMVFDSHASSRRQKQHDPAVPSQRLDTSGRSLSSLGFSLLDNCGACKLHGHCPVVSKAKKSYSRSAFSLTQPPLACGHYGCLSAHPTRPLSSRLHWLFLLAPYEWMITSPLRWNHTGCAASVRSDSGHSETFCRRCARLIESI